MSTDPATSDGFDLSLARRYATRHWHHESPQRLVMVSNRAPVERCVDAAGQERWRCSTGGLATALSSAPAFLPVTWVAGAATPQERALADRAESVPLEGRRRLRFVTMPEAVYRPFYGVFANPILWFLQHGLWHRLQCPDVGGAALRAWQEGYVPANQTFAEAVVDELDRCEGTPWVMLHDYHLYVAGLFVRHLCPDAVLQHVVHIPWPEPEAWQHLPREIVESILTGLLANDSLVFQTDAFAARFLLTCQAWLSRAHVDEDRRVVTYEGHETQVWVNPVSVDPLELRACLSLPETRRYRERLASLAGERTIVRVDRLDPSKHVAAGFRAFRRLLERWPEWRGRVRFLAFLVPSRTTVPEYQAYAAETFREIEAVNAQFGGPVTVFYEQNRLQALAGLTLYDVLLVNPVADGLNLVSKEGPVLNERDGVLVLSETAGAFAELGDAALPVRADDIEGTAEALDAALRMPKGERRERAAALRKTIARHDVARWMRLLVDDLERRSTLRLPLESSAPLSGAP